MDYSWHKNPAIVHVLHTIPERRGHYHSSTSKGCMPCSSTQIPKHQTMQIETRVLSFNDTQQTTPPIDGCLDPPAGLEARFDYAVYCHDGDTPLQVRMRDMAEGIEVRQHKREDVVYLLVYFDSFIILYMFVRSCKNVRVYVHLPSCCKQLWHHMVWEELLPQESNRCDVLHEYKWE